MQYIENIGIKMAKKRPFKVFRSKKDFSLDDEYDTNAD